MRTENKGITLGVSKGKVRSSKPMKVTDPIADMLTRIRNGFRADHETVEMPNSKLKESIAKVLHAEGYIDRYQVVPGKGSGTLRIKLKYMENNVSVIDGIERVSKSGKRIFAGKGKMPKVLQGLGILIVTTSSGVMSDREARAKGIGGEILAKVW